MENQITKRMMDIVGPITDNKLHFGNYNEDSTVGGQDITALIDDQKQQVEQLIKEHYLVKDVKWINHVGGASKPGEAILAKTYKLVDEGYETYEGKTIYIYQVMFSPKMYDPKTIYESVKDGCTLTPLFYNPETFTPYRKIVIEYSPEYTNEILTDEDMKQHLRGKLEKVLANPGEYQAEGFRACLLRFAAK